MCIGRVGWRLYIHVLCSLASLYCWIYSQQCAEKEHAFTLLPLALHIPTGYTCIEVSGLDERAPTNPSHRLGS